MIRRVFLSLLFIVVFSGKHALAMGISPAILEVNDVLAGASAKGEVFVSRGDASKTEKIKIIIDGPSAKYITLLNNSVQELPQGEHTSSIPFTIETKTLASGQYNAFLIIAPFVDEVSGSGGSGSSVLSGAKTEIRFTVTNEAIEQYTIDSILTQDMEDQDRFGFSFLVRNTGNADARPEKIEVQTEDTTDPNKITSTTILNDQMKIIPAFSQETVSLLSNLTLGTGIYKVTIIIYDKDNNVIKQQVYQNFQVWPKGTLAQKGELVSFDLDKADYSSAELVGMKALFKNIGTIGLSPVLNTEIFLGDERLDVIKSDPVYVLQGKEVEFENTFRPVKGGKYIVKASVHYGPNKTEMIEKVFQVGGGSYVMIISILIAGVILISVSSYFLFYKKNSSNGDTSASPPSSPVGSSSVTSSA